MIAEDLTLLSDDANYRDTLQTYLKYMEQLPPQKLWMKEELGPRIAKLFEAKKEIRVLAVGTGTGEVDVDFLAEITKRGREVHGEDYSVVYQVVEPNPESVEYFKGVVTKDDNLSKVTFQWFTGFFDPFCEEFKKTASKDTRFDFAHYVRCTYHIDSVSALQVTYEHLLRKNGVVAVVGENENAFWPRMMPFLAKHEMKHECFTCSGPVSDAYFLPGWKKQAETNGWKFDSWIKKYNFNITPMYDPESKPGNYLIDFALHGKNCRQTISKVVLDDFFELLNAHSHEEEVEVEGVKEKRRHYPCELGAIMITKE